MDFIDLLLVFVLLGFVLMIGGGIGYAMGAARRKEPGSSAAPQSQHSSAAGWYPDPQQPGHLRFWDGSAWSEQPTRIP